MYTAYASPQKANKTFPTPADNEILKIPAYFSPPEHDPQVERRRQICDFAERNSSAIWKNGKNSCRNRDGEINSKTIRMMSFVGGKG